VGPKLSVFDSNEAGAGPIFRDSLRSIERMSRGVCQLRVHLGGFRTKNKDQLGGQGKKTQKAKKIQGWGDVKKNGYQRLDKGVSAAGGRVGIPPGTAGVSKEVAIPGKGGRKGKTFEETPREIKRWPPKKDRGGRHRLERRILAIKGLYQTTITQSP